jgi:hypothetical protein
MPTWARVGGHPANPFGTPGIPGSLIHVRCRFALAPAALLLPACERGALPILAFRSSGSLPIGRASTGSTCTPADGRASIPIERRSSSPSATIGAASRRTRCRQLRTVRGVHSRLDPSGIRASVHAESHGRLSRGARHRDGHRGHALRAQFDSCARARSRVTCTPRQLRRRRLRKCRH